MHRLEQSTPQQQVAEGAATCYDLQPSLLFLGHPVVIFTFSLWLPSSIQSLPYYEVIIVGIIQNPVFVCIVLYPLFSIHLLTSPAKTS